MQDTSCSFCFDHDGRIESIGYEGLDKMLKKASGVSPGKALPLDAGGEEKKLVG